MLRMVLCLNQQKLQCKREHHETFPPILHKVGRHLGNRNHACAFLAPGFAVIGTLQMAGVSMCGASLSLTLPICCQICLGKVRITSLVLLVSLKSYCAKYIKQNDNRRLFRSATVVSPGQRTSGLLQSTCVLLHVHGCVAGLS